jgi:hypothetical protein
MSGDCAVRKAEDIGGQELSYAEVKAIASGNPAVLTLAETDAELHRLAILRKNHADEQYLARRNLRDLPDETKRLTRRVNGLTTDLATMNGNNGSLSVEVIGDRMNRMPDKVDKAYNTKLGKHRGLEAGIILHPLGGTEVYLDGAVRCREQLIRDNPGPRAVLNALERVADGYESDIRHLKAEIAVKQGQFKDFESRLGREFEHESYRSELTDLRDRLKLGLSEHAPEGGESVAELAEKIKVLRESVTVEATPERTVRKTVRAERPVTARIRERMVEKPVAEAVEVKPEPVASAEPPAQVIPMPVKPVEDYRQNVTRRREDGKQMSLF